MTKFESGYFDRENRRYIITNMTPTRPLVNHIWSEEFMMTLDHFGCGSSFGKVGNDDGMMIGARRFQQQPAQQRMVGIAQFHQLGGGRQIEQHLHHHVEHVMMYHVHHGSFHRR